MAAYGLYTHIASNKFRSIVLLAVLFAQVYLMVYAGALLGEALSYGGAPLDYYLVAAARDRSRHSPTPPPAPHSGS